MLTGLRYNSHKKLVELLNWSERALSVDDDQTGYMPYCLTQNDISSYQFPFVRSIDIVNKKRLREEDIIQMFKVTVDTPTDIAGSSQALSNKAKTWESHIKFHMNYLYDHGLIPSSSVVQTEPIDTNEGLVDFFKMLLSQPIPDIPMVALDIEVDDSHGMPNAYNPMHEIITIALHHSDGSCVVYDTKHHGSEKEILLKVFEIIDGSPCVVTFNGDEFDLLYMFNRASKLDIVDKCPIYKTKEGMRLKHGTHIDLYPFCKMPSVKGYVFGGVYQNNGLEDIVSGVLKEHKMSWDRSQYPTIKSLPSEMRMAYCKHDAYLVNHLMTFNNRQLFNVMVALSRITKMPLEDLTRMPISEWIRSMIIWEHRLRNCLIPNRDDFPQVEASTKAIIKGKAYKGAVVLPAPTGVFFNVVVIDFGSLYPSMFKVYNLSYETVNCIHEECKQNKVPETSHWFCSKKQGITSLLIGALRDVRLTYFKPMGKTDPFYKSVEQALKVLLNATYGVFGYKNFAFFYMPVAESTTALGRAKIMDSADKAGKLGIVVIYGDTDSLFLNNPDKTKVQQVIAHAKTSWGIDLEIDKEFKWVAFGGRKKNYLGVTPDGKTTIKGLTGKKSNTPKFIKVMFNIAVDRLKVCNNIDDIEREKKVLSLALKNSIDKFKRRDLPIHELAFNVVIHKAPSEYGGMSEDGRRIPIPQHIRALLNAGIDNMAVGSVVSYIKTATKSKIMLASKQENVKYLDVDIYLKNMESVFAQILDPLDMDFDEVLGHGKQVPLDNWVDTR